MCIIRCIKCVCAFSRFRPTFRLKLQPDLLHLLSLADHLVSVALYTQGPKKFYNFVRLQIALTYHLFLPMIPLLPPWWIFPGPETPDLDWPSVHQRFWFRDRSVSQWWLLRGHRLEKQKKGRCSKLVPAPPPVCCKPYNHPDVYLA
jgi:hypothetical protein